MAQLFDLSDLVFEVVSGSLEVTLELLVRSGVTSLVVHLERLLWLLAEDRDIHSRVRSFDLYSAVED